MCPVVEAARRCPMPAGAAGELQVHTANTAQDVVDGNWHATQTDVATWFSSTFNVVTIKASAIQIIYEG